MTRKYWVESLSVEKLEPHIQRQGVRPPTLRNTKRVVVPETPTRRFIRATFGAIFDLTFEPLVDAVTGETVASEALISPIAEDGPDARAVAARATACGAERELGRLVRATARLRSPGSKLVVRPQHGELDATWLVQPEAALVDQPAGMIVAIDESVPLSHRVECARIVAASRERHVELMIDALGAGESNIRAIADLEPAFVRIDRGITSAVRRDDRCRRLVTAMVTMCHAMGSRVVARVEDGAELDALVTAGVDLICGSVGVSRLLATRVRQVM